MGLCEQNGVSIFQAYGDTRMMRNAYYEAMFVHWDMLVAITELLNRDALDSVELLLLKGNGENTVFEIGADRIFVFFDLNW